jgi:hypothetical protein
VCQYHHNKHFKESSYAFEDKTHSNQIPLLKIESHRINFKLEYIGTKEHVTDIFKKPLPNETFEYLRQNMGVILCHTITKALQEKNKLRGELQKERRLLVAK